jgi:hypothetical protein
MIVRPSNWIAIISEILPQGAVVPRILQASYFLWEMIGAKSSWQSFVIEDARVQCIGIQRSGTCHQIARFSES